MTSRWAAAAWRRWPNLWQDSYFPPILLGNGTSPRRPQQVAVPTCCSCSAEEAAVDMGEADQCQGRAVGQVEGGVAGAGAGRGDDMVDRRRALAGEEQPVAGHLAEPGHRVVAGGASVADLNRAGQAPMGDRHRQ